jgi:hypothetical protein
VIAGENMRSLPSLILVSVIGTVATHGYAQTPATSSKKDAKAEIVKARAAKEPKSNKKMSSGEGAAYAGAYATGVPQGQPVAQIESMLELTGL